MIVVDFAKTSNIDSWMELLDEVEENFPGLDKAQYKTALEFCIETKEAIVATYNQYVIGALAFMRDEGEIAFLAVHPNFRKRGIGKAMVNKMLSCFENGTKISVSTYRDGDESGTPAREFYKNMGFTAEKTVTKFDYPCEIMSLVINKEGNENV